jgi:hypothetical protein
LQAQKKARSLKGFSSAGGRLIERDVDVEASEVFGWGEHSMRQARQVVSISKEVGHKLVIKLVDAQDMARRRTSSLLSLIPSPH